MSAIIGIAALGSFTFHYVSINTGATLEKYLGEKSLHSTMFLLIRRFPESWKSFLDTFTFHYVSINTNIVFGFATDFCNFTFHYVSINTKLPISVPQSEKTLHSTMFLLIQPLFPPRSCPFQTLHSTMFLLIPIKDIVSYTGFSNFTFHYVSINTAAREWRRISERSLHSTMFLLIPSGCGIISLSVINFTFHYVSINTLMTMVI